MPIYVQHLRLQKSDYILRRDRRLVIGHEMGVAQSSLDRRGCDLMFPTSMRREVEILNELGLHARPAAEFVRAVQKFKCEITIRKGDDGESFSAGSILEVMSANLDCGTRMTMAGNGPDAEEALDRLEQLLGELAIRN